MIRWKDIAAVADLARSCRYHAPSQRVAFQPPLPVPRERVGVRVIWNSERPRCSKTPSPYPSPGVPGEGTRGGSANRLRRSVVSGLLCTIACICVAAWNPSIALADQSTTAPASAPASDPLAHANELLSAALDDRSAGKPEDALAKYQSASEIYLKAQGTGETTEAAACLTGEGFALAQLGRDADALPKFKRATEICLRLHKNEDDEDLATAMANLANCLANLGRNDEALPLDQAALEMRQRLAKGEDSPDVAWSMTSVARRLAALDRNEDALPLYQKALEMRGRMHKGQDDADVAEAYCNLGGCLQDLGRPADALTNLQAALQMKQRLNKGADDADVATTQNSVAFCLFALGATTKRSRSSRRRWRCAGASISRTIRSM